MALLLKQVNTTPHRFELAAPPRVFLDRTIQGPKTSKPTLVKGGATSVLSVGEGYDVFSDFWVTLVQWYFLQSLLSWTRRSF